MCITGIDKIFESLTGLPVSIVINSRASAHPCLAALLLLCCFEGCTSAVLAVSTKGRTRWQHHFLFYFIFLAEATLCYHNVVRINVKLGQSCITYTCLILSLSFSLSLCLSLSLSLSFFTILIQYIAQTFLTLLAVFTLFVATYV